ncbi:MAG: hypothetical protein RQ936_01520 [Gammaproteobacteria bacterium]|nr:hypothetical protein [Gammaproteobacteria bacterium]
MKNSIVVSAEFYFKGEKYTPSMVIDLDEHIKSKSSDEAFHLLLAKNNSIDTYSYEYEVLLDQPLRFSDAEGMARHFLNETDFDFAAFTRACQQESILEAIADIARTHLAVTDLSTRPELQAALVEAFEQGRKS